MNTTLGIDQSYTSSGYCVVDGDGKVTTFGTFKTQKTLDIYDRAVEVASFIVKQALEYKAERIHIEGLAFGIRGDATRDLAGLLFTIITTIRRLAPGVHIEIIAPTSLKKFATGSGKSDKTAMISMVPEDVITRFTEAGFKKTTGLRDLCDAYWLAQYKH